MDKDSLEYRVWRAYIIILALVLIIVAACMAILVAIFAPEEPSTRQFLPYIIILGMIIWLLAAFGSYSRAQAMYQKRMSGWTPLELNPREGFFTSRLIKLIQKIRGK